VATGEHFEAFVVSEAFRGKTACSPSVVYAGSAAMVRRSCPVERTLTPEEAADG